MHYKTRRLLVAALNTYFLKVLLLQTQRQIRDILQGVSSLGVQFTRKFLALYEKQFSS